MAAASSDRDAKRSEGLMGHLGVDASATIYQGTLVALNHSTGYAKANDDTSSNTFLGVAYEQADNSSGAADAKTVKYYTTGEFEFVHSGLAATDIGKEVYGADDQTVATSGNVKVGRLVGYVSASKVRVRIDGYC